VVEWATAEVAKAGAKVKGVATVVGVMAEAETATWTQRI
jgi:hypothetical protein